MFFSRKKRHNTQIALVFDIGSASVAGALVLFRAGKKPHVLYHTRSSIPFQKELEFKRLARSMLTTFEGVVTDIERKGLPHITFTKKGHKQISRIFCSYASPWYLSQTKVLTINRNEPFTLSRGTVDSLISREENKLLKSGKVQFGEHELSGDIIEKAVTDIKLNGYTVHNPYGKRTKQASFTLSISVLSKQLKSSVEDLLKSRVQPEEITHHSFALVGFSGIRDLADKARDFLFVDVTGEVTDIALIKNEMLTEVVSFPQGAHAVLRTIMRTLNISMREARTLIELYYTQAVGSDSKIKLEKVLTETHQKWRSGFIDALSKIGSGGVPRTVYLTADNDLLRVFSDFIAYEEWRQRAGKSTAFSVLPISSHTLSPHIMFREREVTDPFLALESLYAYKILYTV